MASHIRMAAIEEVRKTWSDIMWSDTATSTGKKLFTHCSEPAQRYAIDNLALYLEDNSRVKKILYRGKRREGGEMAANNVPGQALLAQAVLWSVHFMFNALPVTSDMPRTCRGPRNYDRPSLEVPCAFCKVSC